MKNRYSASLHVRRALRATSIIVTLVLLSGCVGIPSREVDPRTLTAPTTDKKFILKDSYTWAAGRVGATDIKYVLSGGAYRAEYSGDMGTYYRGPEKCVSVVGGSGEKTTVFKREGGIIIPHFRDSSPQIYLYKSSDLTPSQVVPPASNASVEPHGSILDSTHTQQLQSLVVPPTAGPKEMLTKGIGAGIGAVIVTAVIAASEGKIMVPDNQPSDGTLMSLIDF